MGYNVVIVDDDESILESLETYIKTKEELNVICFEDPMKAIDFGKINTVHVAIVDIVLPQMDGLELVKNLKSLNALTYTAVITGNSSIDRVLTAIEYGANDYILKPFNLDDIDEVIETGLKMVRKWRKVLKALLSTEE